MSDKLFVDRSQLAVDPICGMRVDPATTPWSSTVDSETFYFCNPGCKAKFDAQCGTGSQPVRRPQGGRSTAADGLENPSHIEYTCPMHPDVVRTEPGTCPICGMALEPRTATLEE